MPVLSAPLRRFRPLLPVLSLALPACAPDLPAEAAQRAAEQAAQLEAGFTAAGQAHERAVEQAWVFDATQSGRRVATIGEGCDGVDEIASIVVEDIQRALATDVPFGSDDFPDWQATFARLERAMGACTIETIDVNRPAPIVLTVEHAPDTAFRADLLPGFRDGFRRLVHSQTLYYQALARAAEGEDITALAAASQPLAESFGGAVGFVSLLAVGVDLGPVAEALVNLAFAVENAVVTARRYDAIEQALETVNPQMQAVENAMGLSILFIQSDTAATLITSDLEYRIRLYNTTDPMDLEDSRERLEAATQSLARARALISRELMRGVGNIAELHQDLLNEVRRRDGQFAATLGRLAAIAQSAEALATAIDTLRNEGGG